MLKYGTITQINNGKAIVKFDELNTSSGWLQVIQKGSYQTKEQDIPEPGTKVACLMDENLEEGCVLGAFYSDEETLPDNDPNHIVRELADSFKYLIDKIGGSFSTKFKNISAEADAVNLNTKSFILNGVDLIGFLNGHSHPNGNNGTSTGAPTEQIPNG